MGDSILFILGAIAAFAVGGAIGSRDWRGKVFSLLKEWQSSISIGIAAVAIIIAQENHSEILRIQEERLLSMQAAEDYSKVREGIFDAINEASKFLTVIKPGETKEGFAAWMREQLEFTVTSTNGKREIVVEPSKASALFEKIAFLNSEFYKLANILKAGRCDTDFLIGEAYLTEITLISKSIESDFLSTTNLSVARISPEIRETIYITLFNLYVELLHTQAALDAASDRMNRLVRNESVEPSCIVGAFLEDVDSLDRRFGKSATNLPFPYSVSRGKIFQTGSPPPGEYPVEWLSEFVGSDLY